MSCTKGTPTYWKKILFDVLAIMKQLGVPTFFMILSFADLRWNELKSVINKLNQQESAQNIDSLDYHERYQLLNSISVIVIVTLSVPC